MKILFFTSGSVRSNFTYRALTVAKLLAARGHDVSLVAPTADKYNNFIPEKIAGIGGVKILQPFQFKTKQMILNLVPYLLRALYFALRERPDLVYIYKPTPISAVGLCAKLFFGSEVLLDMDDLGSEVMKIEGHPAYQRLLVKWSEDVSARMANRIVAASTYLERIYKERYPHTPVHLMPNGAEEAWLDAPVSPTDAPKRIVFMGAVNRTTILEPLFDALPTIIKKHPDTRVLIMGDGACLDFFKEKASSLGVGAQVEFAGWLPLEQARERLRAGDIGYSFMPDQETNRAASNMKVPQYMARGVVPLVSDVGDLPATVGRGSAGYIAKNAAEVESALMHALEDPERREKAQAARAKALEGLNWDSLARSLEEWLLPRRKGGQPLVYVVATNVPGEVGGPESRNYHLLRQLLLQVTPRVCAFVLSSPRAEARGNFAPEIGRLYKRTQEKKKSLISDAFAFIWDRVPPFMSEHARSGIGEALRAACENELPDVVHIEQLDGYFSIRRHIPWLKRRGVKIVLDCHNVEYRAFRDSLSISPLHKRLLGALLVPRLRQLEIEAATRADAVIACSKQDAAVFARYCPRTRVVANGVDCSQFPPHTGEARPSLVFMGGVEYPPNADALEFYMRSIHPRIKERIRDIRVYAIGATPEWFERKSLKDPQVEPLGFVKDIRPYLARAGVGVCPVRHGSGTRIKILTYMASGLAVVSTAKGAEGVAYADGENIRLADDASSFADAVLSLLLEPGQREVLAKRGREFVAAQYDWNVLGRDLKDAYASVLTS